MGLLYVAVGLLVLFYVVFPLIIFATFKINARANIQPIDVPQMPPEVYQLFGRTAPQFSALGFELVAYLSMPGSVANVTPYLAFWLHRRTGQSAAATVIYGNRPDGGASAKSYVEFVTKYADGLAIQTNNSTSIGSFRTRRDADTLWAAMVQDVGELYALHNWREKELARADPPRFLAAPGQELPVFADAYEYTIRRQVELGYFRETAEAGVYRPTLTGAFGMAWAELPPMKSMRRSRAVRRAEEQRAAASARPVPPPISPRISHQSPYRTAAAGAPAAALAPQR